MIRSFASVTVSENDVDVDTASIVLITGTTMAMVGAEVGVAVGLDTVTTAAGEIATVLPDTPENVGDAAFKAVTKAPLVEAVCNDADRLLTAEVVSAKPRREGIAAML